MLKLLLAAPVKTAFDYFKCVITFIQISFQTLTVIFPAHLLQSVHAAL